MKQKILRTLMLSAIGFTLFYAVSFAAPGTTNTDSVCLRSSPSTKSKILNTFPKGTSVDVLDKTGQWYKVKVNDTYGWIHGSLLKVTGISQTGTTQTGAFINARDVNLREGGGQDFKIIADLDKGAKVTILERGNFWFKVKTSKGSVGWVSKQFVSQSGNVGASVSRSGNFQRVSSFEAGSDIVSTAKKLLGIRYVWGGNTPDGFDCSGFTKYVFAKHGIYLNRVAVDQASQGYRVSKGELSSGDLVFFDTDGGGYDINHVGIYIGGGNFIHSSSGLGRSRISNLNEGFYQKSYLFAKRVGK